MNERTIDPTLLGCLAVLIEEGSVSRAAARLGLSQPAVSHALRRLRERFDDPLLVRAGSRMLPTPRGRELGREAREIAERIERLLLPRAAFDPRAVDGAFVVSAPEYVEHLLCPLLVRTLHREAPRARLWVRPPDPLQADRQLEAGEIDLRLGWVREPAPSMRSRLLFTDRFVCLLRADHPAAQRPLTMERYAELAHVRAQASVPSTASRLMDEAVRRAGARIDVALVVPSHLTIGRVVAGTDLIATVPSGIARSLLQRLPIRMLPSPLKIPPLRVSMYWHERVHRDARHRWLRALVSQAAAAVADI